MVAWFRAFLPKEERFFGHFNQHSQIIVAGAEAQGQQRRYGGDSDGTHGERHQVLTGRKGAWGDRSARW